jgi:hypothetical protein
MTKICKLAEESKEEEEKLVSINEINVITFTHTGIRAHEAGGLD